MKSKSCKSFARLELCYDMFRPLLISIDWNVLSNKSTCLQSCTFPWCLCTGLLQALSNLPAVEAVPETEPARPVRCTSSIVLKLRDENYAARSSPCCNKKSKSSLHGSQETQQAQSRAGV